VLDAAGNALQLETQGVASVNGKALLTANSHVAAVSLDGRPLDVSQSIALLPFGEGNVTLSRGGQAILQAASGEVRDRAWHSFGTPVGLTQTADACTVSVSPENRLSVILLTAGADATAAGAEIALRLTR
jgi:hypothetical protein